MAEWTIRGMRGEDLADIMEVARLSLPADPMCPELFARRVFLDQNFSPATALVAEHGGRVAGFVTGFARRYPIEDMPDDSNRSWITLFAVHPDARRNGAATALFDHLEETLQEMGKSSVLVGPYVPNWWVPGVDEKEYPEAIEFLSKRGYSVVTRPLSMDSDLVGYRRPQWVSEKEKSLTESGVRFQDFRPEVIPALFGFLKREFPGDWQRHLRATCQRILQGEYSSRQVQVATEDGEVVGFAHYEGERFGPFGTAPAVRGRGIGAVLLCRTIEAMRENGLHNAYFLWTSDESARLYSSAAGFRESRRFALMKKELGG
ncbi:MAG: GNAT family N-acetyltransferase [Armatimonadota bacterium]